MSPVAIPARSSWHRWMARIIADDFTFPNVRKVTRDRKLPQNRLHQTDQFSLPTIPAFLLSSSPVLQQRYWQKQAGQKLPTGIAPPGDYNACPSPKFSWSADVHCQS